MSENRNSFLESIKVDLGACIDTFNSYKFGFRDIFFAQALDQHIAISKAFNDLDFYTVVRIKSFTSTINKLKQKGIENVYDIHGIKHVLRNVNKNYCYEIQHFLEKFYSLNNINLIDSRTKDYIASPKSNHYQAIHQSAIVPNENGRRFEVQIKTDLMEKIAKFGEASHANYYKPRVLGNYPTTKVPEYMIIRNNEDGSVSHLLTFEECFQYFYNISFQDYINLKTNDKSETMLP